MRASDIRAGMLSWRNYAKTGAKLFIVKYGETIAFAFATTLFAFAFARIW